MIAEPANPAARLARYLAPKPEADWRIEEEPVIPLVFVLGVATILGVGGRGVGVLVSDMSERSIVAEVWLGFDVLLALLTMTAYALTARYGIRFPRRNGPGEADDLAAAVHVIVVQGNTAWRALPRTMRKQHEPTVRALNASARLLLIDPSDERSKLMLTQHVQTLRNLATGG